MNQLFQGEVFSSPTTRPTAQAVSSTVRAKVAPGSREQQEDFSAVVEEVMKKSECAQTETETKTEKKMTSSNSMEESNLSALAGMAFLLSDLSVEQTAVNADNLTEEESNALTTAMMVESGKPLTDEVASQSSSDGRMPLEGEAVTGEITNSSVETRESSVETNEYLSPSKKASSPADLEGEVSEEVEKADSLAKGAATAEQAGLNSKGEVGRGSDHGALEQEETVDQFGKSLRETVGSDRKDGKEGEDRSSGLAREVLAGAKHHTSVKNAGEFSDIEINPNDFTVSSRLSSAAESVQSLHSTGEFTTDLTDQVELAEKVVEQVQTGARVMVKDGVARVEMHLEPKELGKLELTLVIDRDVVAAKFVAESKTVQSIIESNLDSLRSSLQEAGLKADSIQVGVETGGFGFDGQKESTFNSKQGFQFTGMDFLAEENEEFQVDQAQVWGRVDFRA